MKYRLVICVSFVSVTLGAGASSASCVMPPPTGRAVKEADIVFIGTVTKTTNSHRWATVKVEEIWKGDDIDRVVEIKAGPADPPGPTMVASSNDRTFQEGVRYLFFPYRGKDALRDSSCSNTTRFTPELERFRPASVRELSPPSGGDDVVEDDSIVPAVLAGAGAGLVVSLVVVFVRKRIND